MKSVIRRPLAAFLVMALAVSGCASTGQPGEPRTALDRSVGQCAASLAVGAILGALVGAAAGGRNAAGQGAAIGAGAGAVACAVIIAANNAEDRERIRQSRLAALQSGKDDVTQYTAQDGSSHVVRTSVQSVPVPAQPQVMAGAAANGGITGPCRRAQAQITIPGKGTAALEPETVCRTVQGDWVPLDAKKTV